MSMIDHFRDLLEAGKTPTDPFQDAIDRVLSSDAIEDVIRSWNNRIAMHYGGEDKMKARMHRRRAVRTLRR